MVLHADARICRQGDRDRNTETGLGAAVPAVVRGYALRLRFTEDLAIGVESLDANTPAQVVPAMAASVDVAAHNHAVRLLPDVNTAETDMLVVAALETDLPFPYEISPVCRTTSECDQYKQGC